MKNIKCLILIVGMFFFSMTTYAKSIAYDIGTTDYMIREARQAKAFRHSPEHYNNALLHQKWAKQALSGQLKVKNKSGITYKIRSKAKAREFTESAYLFAKSARNQSLQALGKKF